MFRKYRGHAVTLSVLALALALLTGESSAARSELQKTAQRELRSADLSSPHSHRSLARSRKLVPGMGAEVTVDDVGDVDSFGRNLHWLGLKQANVALSADCTGLTGPGSVCQVLNPAPALTSFSFSDITRIKLPKNASNSLLCYWWSPVLTVRYANPTAVPVVARLSYAPTLTIENSVLDDPSLIDPTTGAPFGGQLLTSMTSVERFEVPLPAGVGITERSRDSAVCIAGFVSRKALIDNYGLTEAQASEFFKRETTVRVNISGSTHYVDDANLVFGFRIIGD